MGTWGPGVFENDHANDLLSIHTHDWAVELRALDDPATSWDDIEGMLAYVYLLGVAGRAGLTHGMLVDKAKPESSRAVATRWKERFLAIEGARDTAFHAERVAIVTQTFDELIAAASDEDAPAPGPPRRVRPIGSKRNGPAAEKKAAPKKAAPKKAAPKKAAPKKAAPKKAAPKKAAPKER